MKIGIVSDLHCHIWSTFATTNSDGINSRLATILSELERAAATVKDAGGSLLLLGGDLFHKRGTIDPEVLNPVRETFGRILRMGVSIAGIPGNHDLKSRDTSALSSAVQNLDGLSDIDAGMSTQTVTLFNEPTVSDLGGVYIAYVPWREDTGWLLKDIEDLLATTKVDPAQTYLLIHAGIDGVLAGMPDHGLTAAKLGAFGFRGVFSGHYHNHKALDHNVYSIGSLTHQTWGDIGTKAGFLLLDTDANTVQYNATHAPMFLDVSELDEDDLAMDCPGNYVRFRGPHMTQDQINELREELVKYGAAGVLIQVARSTPSMRPAASAAGKVMSLDDSVSAYVDGRKDIPVGLDAEEIKRRAQIVLNEARMVDVDAS